jgi:hypothetical protein
MLSKEYKLGQQMVKETSFFCSLGVKPLIHQSELGTYTKVIPFQEKRAFHFVVL